MRIFVTGATGFIGLHLVNTLLKEGHAVTALVRSERKLKLLPAGVDVIRGDLSLFADPNLKLPEFDIVIHLAGVIFEKNRAGYMKYNFEAVKDLASCLERQKWKPKRFLFASSLAASGPSKKDQIMTEADQPNPIDFYGEAKWLAEQHLDANASFPTTSFRPAIVLGSGDENSLTLFKMAKLGLGIKVDDKAQQISFVDVVDLNAAILLMIKDDSERDRTFFVAHPEQTSNVGLFKVLRKVMKTQVWLAPLPKPILFLAMKGSTFFSKLLGVKNQLDEKQYQQLTHHFQCSGQLLKDEFGWRPQHDLEASILKAYEGYKLAGKL